MEFDFTRDQSKEFGGAILWQQTRESLKRFRLKWSGTLNEEELLYIDYLLSDEFKPNRRLSWAYTRFLLFYIKHAAQAFEDRTEDYIEKYGRTVSLYQTHESQQ